MIDFETDPGQYRHWRLRTDGEIAYLTMDVDEKAGLFPGYELKLNSYDLGVDIELYDAAQRLRFEHPEVRAVIVESGKERVFCSGANIRMLGGASHAHKVNFCKFTNETRNAIEEAGADSGQHYLCAVNGTAAGGGYELALATEHIVLVDDGSAAVSLPEVPLLAVLPGTGGLTRLVDKRRVRRDLADVFCTVEEGIRGQRALDWRLVDEILPSSRFAEGVVERARTLAASSGRPADAEGIRLTPLSREISDGEIRYPHLRVELDRSRRVATLVIHGPDTPPPADVEQVHALGVDFYPLALVRALDDALLQLRFNEPQLGTLIFKTQGDGEPLAGYDAHLFQSGDWLLNEIVLYWKRTLKRLDVTSRTTIALIEPGSCFAGFVAELLFAVDRSYMLDGCFEGDDTPPARIRLSAASFGPLPMGNGLTRLATRFYGEPERVAAARQYCGQPIDAATALDAGLITFAPDDIDWDDEIRMLLEERASFSPDSLTGLEANLRFAGPETVETKIFGRLSAWQNWIFQRPNAVGERGALRTYGTGERPDFDHERV